MRTDEGQDPVIEPAQPQRRPGAELARAREEAGIGLRAMADTLHLPEKQVRALENDDYANLPPPTFVRGYLRSYARTLGLDPEEIVGLYDALEVEVDDPALRLYSDNGDRAHNRGLALAITVLALAVALSLGAWWWQARTAESASESNGAGGGAPAAEEGAASADESASGSAEAFASGDAGAASADADGTGGDAGGSATATADTGSAAGDTTQAADAGNDTAQSQGGPGPATDEASRQATLAERESVADTAGSPAAAATETAEDAGDEATAADASAGSSAGSDETAGNAETDSAAASNDTSDGASAGVGGGNEAVAALDAAAEDGGYQPPSQTASADAATAPEADEGPEQLQLNIDGRSWIEIYDARGRELVYTLYTGSEPLRVRGWAPFDVFLGNSPDVSIRFNGETIDKAGFTRSDRTARFLVDASGANRR